ncbi:hypothetical protein QBC35DRAFT_548396 [Podospora australis]|uniref:Uncharacterized protein n=1 Tax=Podospora australis TaxID=1536484 RepID=A0AAN7ACN0_9PEZI|nr:hypothetical protein QBC35DRAFT_548396 [Podospora australis]
MEVAVTGTVYSIAEPILVEGYQIPRRDEENTGMEVPLNIMAQLVNTQKISIFSGKILIKGYSTILVPTQQKGDCIFWHVVSNDDLHSEDNYISYSDPRVAHLLQWYPSNLTISDLEISRHILGWCGEVKNLTGTRDANYKINWSGLRKPPPGCAFEKVTLVGGMFVTGGISCVLGKKDKAVHIRGHNDYIMRLKWISKKFVVLYDAPDRRASMVDGVSALLHLVKSSLHHDKNDAFKDLSLYDDAQLQEPSEPGKGGKGTAIFILTNEQNTKLPLYKKPSTSKEALSVDEVGSQSGRIMKTQMNYTLGERVENICDIREQMIAHQADVSTQDGVGFKIGKTVRKQLEGFDFMDVATDEDPIWPRATTLRATGLGWVDFTRAIHAITLFGSGFGDLFRPNSPHQGSCATCQLNIEVPKGKDYLAVCIPELADILQRRGTRNTGPWRLVDEIHWHAPDKTFEPCNCHYLNIKSSFFNSRNHTTLHDRVQVLIPSSFPSLLGWNLKGPTGLDEHPRGALLFGHSRRFPLRWFDFSGPVEGDPAQDEIHELEASLEDSGIGSSFDSITGSGSQGGAESGLGQSPGSSSVAAALGDVSCDAGRTRRWPRRNEPVNNPIKKGGHRETL